MTRAGYCAKYCPLQHPNIKFTSSNAKGPTGGTTNDAPLIRSHRLLWSLISISQCHYTLCQLGRRRRNGKMGLYVHKNHRGLLATGQSDRQLDSLSRLKKQLRMRNILTLWPKRANAWINFRLALCFSRTRQIRDRPFANEKRRQSRRGGRKEVYLYDENGVEREKNNQKKKRLEVLTH